MKARILSINLVLSLILVSGSYAIDKDAKFIDSIGASGLSYHNGHMSSYGIWGETPVATMSKDWAIIVGGYMGTDSQNSADLDFLSGIFGLKKYFTELTSLQIVGSYMDYDTSYSYNTGGVSFGGKHRFIEVSEGLSPFLTASIGYLSINNTTDSEELIATIGAGCEFMITKDLSIVLEAAYVRGDSLSSDGPEIRNGAMGAIYFTGYWD